MRCQQPVEYRSGGEVSEHSNERRHVKLFTGMIEDVFGNGTSRFAKDIGEYIVQFEIGNGETV